MPAEDVSLYAKWVPVDRTVTFDTRGGSAVESQIVPHMGNAKSPTEPTKEGYVFAGWYTSAEERWSFDQPVADDITLYAYWRPISKTSYTVRHIMQGEEQPFFEETADGGVGDTVVALPLDPKHENYPADVYLTADETSKTILLDSDKNENILTFTYIDAAQKDYTVRYLHKLTNEPVAEEKNVKTKNTVVTEYAANIDDYKVTGDASVTQNIKEHNEIVFYYISTNLKVTYQFESETEGQQLPEEVKKLTPVDDSSYSQGDTVSIKTPIQDSVIVDDGRWVFKGYQLPENEFVIDNDTTITGLWAFEKNAGIINRIPIIMAKDKTFHVGDPFDKDTALKDVTAHDEEDGDVTGSLEVIDHNVDTSAAGTYFITYKATDSQGASSTKTITVVVKDKENVTPAPETPEKPEKPESTPTTTQSDKGTPKTGDHANMSLWMSLLSASGLLLAVLYIRRKTKV